MMKLGQITSDLKQIEMPERPKEMGGPDLAYSRRGDQFFTRTQQVKLETILEGEARHLGAACHQVTEDLQKALVSEPEFTGLE